MIYNELLASSVLQRPLKSATFVTAAVTVE